MAAAVRGWQRQRFAEVGSNWQRLANVAVVGRSWQRLAEVGSSWQRLAALEPKMATEYVATFPSP